MTASTPEPGRIIPCQAKIWPAFSDRWVPCPGVIRRGHCTTYGTQHDQANASTPEPGRNGEKVCRCSVQHGSKGPHARWCPMHPAAPPGPLARLYWWADPTRHRYRVVDPDRPEDGCRSCGHLDTAHPNRGADSPEPVPGYHTAINEDDQGDARERPDQAEALLMVERWNEEPIASFGQMVEDIATALAARRPTEEQRREVYAGVILTHWRTSTSGCACGGMRLGESYPLHVADALLAAVPSLLGGGDQ